MMTDSRQHTPSDTQARVRALDPSTSFIVSAPAGSGKTGLLTQRVLKLLATCQHPEEVLSITFTRKAAKEMHHRIIGAIREAAEYGTGRSFTSEHQKLTHALALQVLARDKELSWNLLLIPNRLRVQTIDGFCQSLIKQLPIDQHFSSHLQPSDNPGSLYADTVREFFKSMTGDSPYRKDFDKLIQHLDNNIGKVESLLTRLLSQRNQWLSTLLRTGGNSQSRFRLEESLVYIVESALQNTNKLIAIYLPELLELGNYAGEQLIKADEQSPITLLHGLDDLECNADFLLQWKALSSLLLTNKGEWRKTINKRSGFPTDKKDPNAKIYKERILELFGDIQSNSASNGEILLEALNDIQMLPEPAFQSAQWQMLDSLTRLLPLLVAEFMLNCQRTGECDFDTITSAALNALGDAEEPTDLALHLDYKINHILVDEFQDTSIAQLTLLEKLTQSWQPDDGKTLFVVGDAMQSCYGFRNANVSIFLGAAQYGIGDLALEPLRLSVNFRSDGTLVNWVNSRFENTFPKEVSINRGAVSYNHADAFFDSSNDAEISIHGFTDEAKKGEALFITDLIKEKLQQDDNSSIAILVRSRPHLQKILQQLRAQEINWLAKDVDPLKTRMIIIDLLSLTKALLDTSDRIAWLSILRAPWCGLDMNDLHQVATQNLGAANPFREGSYPNIWQQIENCSLLSLSNSGLARIKRLNTIFSIAFKNRSRKPLRVWVESVWLALGGPGAIANSLEKNSPEYFFDLLENHDSGGRISDWIAFDESLAKLYDRPTEDSRIQVMTIHKAKGLEFDTVILPGLNKSTRNSDKELLVWQDFMDEHGHAHTLLSPLSEVGEKDELYIYLAREKKIRDNFESARLLYIACTRAIKNLHLTMELKRDEKNGELKSPAAGSLANHIWDAVADDIKVIDDYKTRFMKKTDSEKTTAEHNVAEGATSENKSLSSILRTPDQWQAPPIPIDDTLKGFRGRANFNDENLPEATAITNRTPRHTGTILHRALHHLTLKGTANWNANDIQLYLQNHLSSWSTQLRQLGLNANDVKAGAKKIHSAVAKILDDKTGLWLLDNSHQQSECELSILTAKTGFKESIIDRTFVFKNERWIVDYKSSEPALEESVDSFIEKEASSYQQQLKHYHSLIRGFNEPYPIRTALYFPLISYFHEMDISDIDS